MTHPYVAIYHHIFRRVDPLAGGHINYGVRIGGHDVYIRGEQAIIFDCKRGPFYHAKVDFAREAIVTTYYYARVAVFKPEIGTIEGVVFANYDCTIVSKNI